MNLEKIGPGRDVPRDINVVIEIPLRGEPVKYEVDKGSGAIFVDRLLSTSMYYPCNYGFIPQTLAGDGDPMDVLVVTPIPLLTGSVIRSRPIGMLKMEDEAGEDIKILAVPADKLSDLYRKTQQPEDLPPALLASISHFFEHYKDLESGKWVKVQGWVGRDQAFEEIIKSIENFRVNNN